MTKLRTYREMQEFKVRWRKEVKERFAKGEIQISDFTLAANNKIKKQPLDMSRVEISDYEIYPD